MTIFKYSQLHGRHCEAETFDLALIQGAKPKLSADNRASNQRF